MKILGYLLVLALFGGNNKYNNFSIEVKKVHQLVKDIFKYNDTTDEPHFTKDDLRRGNLINKGTIAKYYSKAIRDYIIYRNVSSEEEGFVLTFNDFKPSPSPQPDNKTAINKEKSPTVIFIPKEGVDVNDVNNKALRTAISEYIDTVQEKINSHEIGATPTKSDLLEVDVENNHLTLNPTKQNNTQIPKELSNSRVYNSNELKESETKINKDRRVENNNQVTKGKTNVRNDNLTKVVLEEFKNPSLDNNITDKNQGTKNSEYLKKFLYESKTVTNPEVVEIHDKNTAKLNQTNITASKDQNSKKIDYDKTVDTKPVDLEVIKDKINISKEHYGISDLLKKHGSLITDVEQTTKDNLSKTNKNIVNRGINTVEEKDKIHKIPKLIEKSHKDVNHINITKNKTSVEQKSANSLKLNTTKEEECQSKFPSTDESTPAISKVVVKSVSATKFIVQNKTNTGDGIRELLEDVNAINSSDSDALKLYEQVDEFIEKHRNKDRTEDKINLENNEENSGQVDGSSEDIGYLTERPSFDKNKESTELNDLVKPYETETADSQEPNSNEATEWNNETNVNGEENNNSETEDTKREPLLEILNLDEVERAEEQGFAIEDPEADKSVIRSSSEEDDWDAIDDYENE